MKVAILNGLSLFLLGFASTIANPTGTTNTIQQQIILSPSGSEAGPIYVDEDAANFIFASFAGLLQQWPNTFAYSGHSIIPGVIPRSTLLYHGTNRGEPAPRGTGWLAFNPEMSYFIHSVTGDQELDLYTFVTTRPLRIIYIDGQSASLGRPGFMDSQSVLINGTVDKESAGKGRLGGEYDRAHELCKIGKIHGFEGVVRMNSGFELIWCDFTQGIEIVQVTNATDPFATLKPKTPGEPETPSRPHKSDSPFWSRAGWINSQAASRQFFAPGEIRVKLDPTGFISFYDRLESLSLKRRADGTNQGPRSAHRLYGISTNDAKKIRERLFKVLARKNDENWQIDSDQVDWQAIVLTIIETYNKQLNQLHYVLERNDLSAIDKAVEVRALSYGMIMPYVDFSSRNMTDTTWARLSIQKCRTAFTSGTYQSSDLTESIRLIIGAIEGTLNRLCATIYDIFSQTMEMSLPNKTASKFNQTLEIEAKSKILEWNNKTVDLIKWLGWPGNCNPSCKPNELCVIPMWPNNLGASTNISNTFPVCRDFTTWEKSIEG